MVKKLTKETFLNRFSKADYDFVAKIFDDINLVNKIDYPIQSKNFLPPRIWQPLLSLQESLSLRIEVTGLTENSEKKCALIIPLDYQGELPSDLQYLKISYDNRYKELAHKHFLAAIMGLGIKRERIGDLIVADNSCFLVASEDIISIITMNLLEIKKLSLIYKIISRDEVPAQEVEELSILVSSMRLDNVVSSLTNESRGNSSKLLDDSKVLLNYNQVKSKHTSLSSGDILTIRGHGKFLFTGRVAETKKGKLRLAFHKFK